MDFLVELVIQVFVQLVGEILFEGVVEGLRHRVGRLVTGGLLGIGFGCIWGAYLSGGAHWPRLLWVSLALAAVAAVAALQQDRRTERDKPSWRSLLEPPWRWSAERLLGLVVINLGIAAGIGITFRPA